MVFPSILESDFFNKMALKRRMISAGLDGVVVMLKVNPYKPMEIKSTLTAVLHSFLRSPNVMSSAFS